MKNKKEFFKYLFIILAPAIFIILRTLLCM